MLTKNFIEDKWEDITDRPSGMYAYEIPMIERFCEFIFMILATPFLIILDIVLLPIELLYYLFSKWIEKYL